MSSRSWTTDGFGVLEDRLNVATDAAKMAFLKKYLPDKYKEMEENAAENGIDLNEYCSEWISEYEDGYGNVGLGALFADAINENEEDLDVICCEGIYDEEAAVMFTEGLPWQMSERVRNMTEDDMRALFAKYTTDLGVDVEANYHSVEYYG